MVSQHSYAIQAENNIFNREQENREAEALDYVKNLQYEFEEEFGYLSENEAILLDIKQSKTDSVETNLKLLSFHIEDKENELFSLIKKRKELKIQKIEDQEDLEKYKQVLRDRKEQENYLSIEAEFQYERVMGADSGEF